MRISYFQYLNFYSDMRFHTNLPFILGRYIYEFLIHELTIKMITCLWKGVFNYKYTLCGNSTVYNDFFAQDILNLKWYFTWYLTCVSLDLSHIQLGFHIAFHMVFHIVTIFTSIFTGILPYLLHPISHIFHMVFHMPYREIPSENAEPISQGFHMIIFTWYFTFLWNNVWKTMWNPCETLKKNHMVFTWTSHTLHRVAPSSARSHTRW